MLRKINLLMAVFFVGAMLVTATKSEAQEPRPARLRWAGLQEGDSLDLVLAWRFHPGDDPAWSAPSALDAGWEALDPRMPSTSRPRGGWTGEGWFRRHVIIDDQLRARDVVLQVDAPGRAIVYLDGALVIDSGTLRTVQANGGSGRALASARVSLRSSSQHVLAVRYVCPCRGSGEIGFKLSVLRTDVAAVRTADTRRDALIYGASAAIPSVLGVLHLALFLYYRRARENLFCALCMLSLAVIIGTSIAREIATSEPLVRLLVAAMFTGIVGATFFGLLTFAVARSGVLPRSWRMFAVAGVAVALTVPFLGPTGQNAAWSLYFAASIVEMARLQLRGRGRTGVSGLPLLIGMLLLDAAITIQIFIAFDVMEPPLGFESVYLFGVLAFSLSTSISVARGFARASVDLERRLEEVQELSAQVIAAERESARRGLEIEAARALQRAILPSVVPQTPHLEIAATVTTASEVGGDYYDFRRVSGEAVIVALGDAAGHGVAAGTMVTATKALFSSMVGEADLPAMLTQCDRVLRDMNVRPLHMCLLLARVTPTSVTVTSAAMPRPLHYSAESRTVAEIEVEGLPLAASLGSQWSEVTVPVAAGDVLLFASDGFAETLAPEGEPVGYERVESFFAAAATRPSSSAIIETLMADAESWRGERMQDDDIAMVAIRILG